MGFNSFDYDISNTSYSDKMNQKTMQYNKLVRKAEEIRIANEGKPSAKEADFYREAAKVCGEIMAINNTQRSVNRQWEGRRNECIEQMEKIAARLNPAPAPEAASPDSRKATVTANGAQNNETGKVVEATNATGDVIKTRNAEKDVPADTIAKWHITKKPKQSFADLSGMDNIKEMLNANVSSANWSALDDILGIKPFQSYFFYGLPGTGKTYVIEAFAHELMNRGYNYIKLVGGDVHSSLVGVAEKTVKIAFQEAIDNEPCVIFMDEIENVCVNRSLNNLQGHEKATTVAFLEAYNNLINSDARVIFLGATNYPSKVDEAMLNRVELVKVPLPDTTTRVNYFTGIFKVLKPEEGFTVQEMAELTDGFNFRDLDHLVKAIALQVKSDAIEKFTVMDGDKVDELATSTAAVKAIEEGRLSVSRELFQSTVDSMPPTDMSSISKEIEEFESRAKGLM